MPNLEIFRGDIIRVDLQPTQGRETRGEFRPCVVVQNDLGNLNSFTTIVVPLTDAKGKKVYPFQALIEKGDGGTTKDSIAKCEQIRVIDKRRIIKKLGHLRIATIEKIDEALCISLEI